MAYSPFVVKRPGIEHGRVIPSTFPIPEGDYTALLGTDTPGWEDRAFRVGDKFELYQEDVKSGAHLVSLESTIRSPSRMPVLSESEPFALADGQTLILAVDEGLPQTITFNAADFAAIGAARATELRDAINAELIGGIAAINGYGQVVIHSNDTGRHKGVEVVGGTATDPNFHELAWYAQLLISSIVVASRRLYPGETRAISDMTANLAGFPDPIEVRFRLILGVVA